MDVVQMDPDFEYDYEDDDADYPDTIDDLVSDADNAKEDSCESDPDASS